jgi:hypothetical protein
VSRVVVLDAGSIGLVTNPKLSPESTLCTRWLQTLITSNIRVIIPEIADIEIMVLIGEIAKAIKARSQFISLSDEFQQLTGFIKKWIEI